MQPISDTGALTQLCDQLRSETYLTLDTEFLRDTTYWPKLCLVQIGGSEGAWAIDPLAPGLDLSPLLTLLVDSPVLKVVHAGRQDVEIIYQLTGKVPQPLFDTQIAAMVCGFGDQVAYDRLVADLVGRRLDKSSRFTDWSRRPLTDRQLRYALDDVIHLRPAFEKLQERLMASGRAAWLDEELATLTDPATYAIEPRESWRRIRTRSTDPRFLAVLREIAALREVEAQRRDVPRPRVLKDEALLEIAAHTPRSAEDLDGLRGVPRGSANNRFGKALVEAIETALSLPRNAQPRIEPRRPTPSGIGPTVELLRVLLKFACEEAGVAQKLVASADDLEKIAADDQADVPCLKGWRRTVFGARAIDLKHGRIALGVQDGGIVVLPLYAVADQ